MMRKGFWLIGLVVLFVLVFSLPSVASDGGVQEIPPLVEVLSLPASVLIGSLVAFLLERRDWFQSLSSRAREALTYGIPLAIAVLARVLIEVVPPSAWAAIEPYWQILAAAGTIWLAGQVAHKADRLS